VGMVAGFKFQKDYDSLVYAARKILQRRGDTTFVCVGDGPELDRIKESARGINGIIFTGKRSDVESIVNIFDIGLLLTDLDRHGEGISNSIMEYMALRKPTIATDGGGTRELVVEGKTGYLIPQKSPDILAGRIEELLNNHKLRDNMGLAAEDRIRKEFTIYKMARAHMSLYEKLTRD
jgi:glycosyltransferase involved in cell wall biosynthesis